MPVIASIDDFERAAQRRLPRILFDYIAGGAYGEETLAANRADFAALKLRQRVLVDVSKIDTTVTLFGRDYSLPLGLAPVGMGGLYARRGEVQAARAAEAAGIPFCLSTVSVCPIEEVVAAVSQPPWFQLYMIKDRPYLEQLLARARAAGIEVLVLTVDLPVPGARYRDVRTGLTGKRSIGQWLRLATTPFVRTRWFYDVHLRGRPHDFGNIAAAIPDARGGTDFYGWIGRNFDPSVTWDDLQWVRNRWPGPIVIKGILDPEDARRAVAAGVEGIVVSNHGGRQLDGVSSSISMLPGIAREVGGKITVLMDGGVRSGLDLFRALALGADACLVGRPWAYAVAQGGQVGVEQMIGIVRKEIEVAMALTGCVDLKDAGPQFLAA